MTSINLIRKEADLYKSTNNWVRLDNQSPHIIKHHSNWRQKTIQNLEFRNDLDLHFSGIYSLNVKYASSFKSHMLNFLKQHTKEMEMVSEEELFILGIDFFKLIKNNNF